MKIVRVHMHRKRCIAKIRWKQRLNELQYELTGFCGRDRSIVINLVLQWRNASFATSEAKKLLWLQGDVKRHQQTETLVKWRNRNCKLIEWPNFPFFFFWEGTTEVRFVKRIVHRHIVQNSSCRNIIIEQIFARTGKTFLQKKSTYMTLYSRLDSKETSTPSEAYCTVLNYI